MKIGDKVSVVDDDLGGIITSVSGKTVSFRDEHGFIHQFGADKLVVQNLSLYENLEVQPKQERRKNQSKKHNKNRFVLDLHFEKLVENPARYEIFERLLIQKEKLLYTLDFCRKNQLKRLEIIHGIGDGVLQDMVHGVLQDQAGLEYRNNEILHHQAGAVLVDFV